MPSARNDPNLFGVVVLAAHGGPASSQGTPVQSAPKLPGSVPTGDKNLGERSKVNRPIDLPTLEWRRFHNEFLFAILSG